MNSTIQPIHPFMRALLAIAAALVFISGIQLFIFSDFTAQYFAWTIKPSLTAATLGAAYWASCALEIAAARQRHWAYARIAVPAVMLFTTITLIVTLLHLDRFHLAAADPLSRGAAWAWLIVYVSVPPLMLGAWIIQARTTGSTPPRQQPLSTPITIGAALLALIFTPLGLALLFAPQMVIPAWPWALTPLTARAIGAWGFALGIAMIHAIWERDYSRIRVATWGIAAFGLLELIAIARYTADIKWELPQAWMYLGFMLFVAIFGVISVVVAQKKLTG
jgi:hypothetical protein